MIHLMAYVFLRVKTKQLDGGKVHFLEQRVRDDIQRELRDVSELEQLLIRSLDTIQEKKRQLEIKRNRAFGELN
jgi:hypothetical protein